MNKKNANGNYEIQWTILVNTNDAANLTPEKAYTGDITVTDTLPAGLTYVDGSATMVTSTRDVYKRQLYILGNAYKKKGDSKNAIKLYNQVIELFPNTEKARRAKDYLKELES